MKAKELREFSDDELKIREEELRQELFNLKFQHSLGQVRNVMMIRNIKKDIARIRTIIKEKEKGIK
jgi:large subunit ribosomal protein L29